MGEKHVEGGNPTTSVCPVIDVINADTFAYQFVNQTLLGSIDWTLDFKWIVKGHHELAWTPNDMPIMSGGIFAINKYFFEELGFYDAGKDSIVEIRHSRKSRHSLGVPWQETHFSM